MRVAVVVEHIMEELQELLLVVVEMGALQLEVLVQLLILEEAAVVEVVVMEVVMAALV
jgi:hypothetical protein